MEKFKSDTHNCKTSKHNCCDPRIFKRKSIRPFRHFDNSTSSYTYTYTTLPLATCQTTTKHPKNLKTYAVFFTFKSVQAYSANHVYTRYTYTIALPSFEIKQKLAIVYLTMTSFLRLQILRDVRKLTFRKLCVSVLLFIATTHLN